MRIIIVFEIFLLAVSMSKFIDRFSEKTDRQSMKTERQQSVKTERQQSVKTERQQSVTTEKKESVKTDRQPSLKTERQPSVKTERQPSVKTEIPETSPDTQKTERLSIKTGRSSIKSAKSGSIQKGSPNTSRTGSLVIFSNIFHAN